MFSSRVRKFDADRSERRKHLPARPLVDHQNVDAPVPEFPVGDQRAPHEGQHGRIVHRIEDEAVRRDVLLPQQLSLAWRQRRGLPPATVRVERNPSGYSSGRRRLGLLNKNTRSRSAMAKMSPGARKAAAGYFSRNLSTSAVRQIDAFDIARGRDRQNPHVIQQRELRPARIVDLPELSLRASDRRGARRSAAPRAPECRRRLRRP